MEKKKSKETDNNEANEPKYYAAIDIGSNAARLLIKRLEKDANGAPVLTKELLLRYPLRLGMDAFSEGKISKEKARKTMMLMKSYSKLLELYGVERYRACATSAMRDSSNAKKLIERIKSKAGIKIEILEGQEEAKIVYENHFECLEDRRGNYMYVDVGGGSTEVNLLVDGELVYTRSFDIGTIRVLTGGVSNEAWQRMCEEIQDKTANLDTINIIGLGGNINKLFKLAETKDKDLKRLPIESLRETYDKLSKLTKEERMQQFGLKSDRADVIEPAGCIFLTIADVVKADYVYVPCIGIADGIIDSMVAKDLASVETSIETC